MDAYATVTTDVNINTNTNNGIDIDIKTCRVEPRVPIFRLAAPRGVAAFHLSRLQWGMKY
jgi:hypothetical protein